MSEWKFSGQRFGYKGPMFVAYFWRSGWTHISLGLHVDWSLPNIEIHLPLGFIRIGVNELYRKPPEFWNEVK